MRAEAALDPNDGISPIPEAGPEDGRAYTIWLRFGERMDQTAIATKLGVTRQRVSQVVTDYLSS
jgi:DNA-binding transcriptional regulator LsrR (DeoR family)